MTTQRIITTILTISIFLFIIPSLCSFASPLDVVVLGKNIDRKQQKEMLDFFNPSPGKYNLVTLKEKNLEPYKNLLIDSNTNKQLSCSYVQPTSKGGLNVKTINLTCISNWLLSDALIISGINNLNAMVASPKQISGLDSFPSVVIGYEDSTGETITPEKITLSTDLIDLILKISSAENISQTRLSMVFSIIEDNVIHGSNVSDTVKSTLDSYYIPLTPQETDTIITLMTKIQSQSYNKKSMESSLSKLNLKIKCKLQKNGQLYGLFSNIEVLLYRLKVKLVDYFSSSNTHSNSIFKTINEKSTLAKNAVVTGDSTLVDILN